MLTLSQKIIETTISDTLKGNLSGNYPEYAREQLDEIENGTANLNVFQGKYRQEIL